MADTTERWDRIRALFEEAVELAPGDVDAFLDEACAGDAALRAEVASLIAADREAPAFLDDPVLVPPPPPVTGLAGTRLGAFRVLHEIGRGGMSVVHLGERAEAPFEQRVAIKVLQRDVSPGDRLAGRLEAEARILAGLDHRGIVRVLDGGVTPDGRPFLVMDHIEGERIDAWCDRRQLTVKERLALFGQVLDAVAYAHRALVVHRDLKPDNILVTGSGEVRLLDFGIAKLLDPDDAAGAALTRTGLRALTPEYAAPEQIRGERITTACDVYALGVLLCELLSGRRPYALDSRSPFEVERAVLETEPDRPSTALRRSPDTGTIAAARGTEPERLRATLDGDLDAIVLKALRKEPEERYASVDAFGEDIERFLGSQPVHARRGSRAYRARKFVRRHRAGVAIAAAILLLILGSTAAIAASRVAAEQARERAEREARTAGEVTEFLIGVFGGSDPFETPGDTVTARTLLEQGRQRIARELRDQPVVRASLLETLGRVYQSLGRFPTADTLLAEAVELRRVTPETPAAAIANALALRAGNRATERDFPAALEHYREALAVLGDAPADTAAQRARLLGGLAGALTGTGQADSARIVIERALALDRARGDSVSEGHLGRKVRLAITLRAQEHLDSAAGVYAETLPRMARALGEDHPDYGLALNNLAFLLGQQRRWEEAVPVYREGLAYVERVLGEDHPRTLLLKQNLGSALFFAGETDAALAVLRERLDGVRKLYPEGHWRVGGANQGIGRMLLMVDRPAEAERVLRDAVAAYGATLGADHSWTLVAEVWVVTAMALQGDRRGPALLDRAVGRLTGVELDGDTRDSLRRIADELDEAGYGAHAEAFRALVAADEARRATS